MEAGSERGERWVLREWQQLRRRRVNPSCTSPHSLVSLCSIRLCGSFHRGAGAALSSSARSRPHRDGGPVGLALAMTSAGGQSGLALDRLWPWTARDWPTPTPLSPPRSTAFHSSLLATVALLPLVRRRSLPSLRIKGRDRSPLPKPTTVVQHSAPERSAVEGHVHQRDYCTNLPEASLSSGACRIPRVSRFRATSTSSAAHGHLGNPPFLERCALVKDCTSIYLTAVSLTKTFPR